MGCRHCKFLPHLLSSIHSLQAVITNFAVDLLQPAAAESSLASDVLFQELGRQISEHPDLVKKAKGIFLYIITKGGKEASQWSKYSAIPG